MKVVAVLACLIGASYAAQIMMKEMSKLEPSYAVESERKSMSHLDYEWDEWKGEHGKLYYENGEELRRRQTWEKNLAFVDQHNAEARAGKHSFTVAMNKFADMDSKEFAKMFLRPQSRAVNTKGCSNSSIYVTDRNYGALPDVVDWRTKGFVTAIKNQGQCGSCWAFSTTGSLEGQHFKSTGKLVSLSEQNLMDCSRPDGDFSCEGGLMDYAFDYIIDHGGIDTEASYPYEAKDETTCRFDKRNIGATMTSCVDVTPRGDEKALKKAVGDKGPVSVAIDASQESFQLYHSGVYDEPMCSSSQLDHGVLAVGYGTEKGGDFWIVKNSWGVSWGVQGYIKMSRNKQNQCGISTSASYPIV